MVGKRLLGIEITEHTKHTKGGPNCKSGKNKITESQQKSSSVSYIVLILLTLNGKKIQFVEVKCWCYHFTYFNSFI